MNNKGQVSLVLTILFSMILITISFINAYESVDIEGWDDFEQNIMKKYPSIYNIEIYSVVPPRINIEFYLNTKLSMEDVSVIFEEVRGFILSENVYKGLQKLHMQKYEYGFGQINIIFIYRENEDVSSKYVFSAAQEVDGEASHNDFKTWYVEYNEYNIEPTR